jgi:nanoRNase/pAp phosphatase (c-di-AMP/oligoRNAs hydrolase)
MPPKKIIVIYHKNCLDGFSSAWTAWKKFGNRAEYIPTVHQTPPPTGLKDKEVYMLDFSYSEPVMESIKKIAKRVTVIDHHVSQKDAIKISDEYVYAVKNSGAVLSWNYFFPGKKMPKLFSYVEDKDIWKFALSGTNELLAAVETVNFDFKAWSKLVSDFNDAKKRKKYFDKGAAIIEFSNKNIDSIANNAEKVTLDGKKCLAVNSPIFVSEIGHILATRAKGMGIVWCKKGNKIKVSLRGDGKVDVSKVAAKYGGGGHKGASSFSFEIKGPIKFPWK